MQEFQQKVLPASVYASLRGALQRRDVPLGLQHQQRRGLLAGADARSQAGRRHDGDLHQQPRQHAAQKLLTVDQSIHWADPLGTTAANNCVNGPPLAAACTQPYAGPIPAVVHLHGNEVLSQYDGHPDAWWTPGFAQKGRAFVSNTYNYPNQQEATTLWFHDHTLGIVRLNVYAGLAGFYFIRDSRDTGLASNPITLPSGAQEAELMIQDRQFDTNGQLYFPDSDNAANLNGPPANPDKHPFWIPEFFGDVITVNGKSWPTMEVQPRRYRFRVVNASNARFLIMQMFNQQGVDMHQNGAPGPAIWQIGSDGGLFNSARQAGRSGQRAQRLRRRAVRQQQRRARGRQVPLPRAGRARRRDRRLRRSGRQDLHAQELRGHPVPQRRPGRVRRAGRDGGRAGHAVQGRPAAAGDATRRSTRPAATRRCAPRRSSTSRPSRPTRSGS